MQHVTRIETRAGLSEQEFIEEYANRQRPVLLRGAFEDWPAARWTPEWFEHTFPDKLVRVGGKDVELATLLARMRDAAGTGRSPYLEQLDVLGHFPELLPYLEGSQGYSARRLPFSSHNRVQSRLVPSGWFGAGSGNLQLFIGGRGATQAIVHVDMPPLHTYSALLHGEKEWWVWAPDQGRHLYLVEDGRSSRVENIFEPDYEKYPDLCHAELSCVTQRAGDLIFLPMGWWHTARTVSDELTITLAWDVLCRQNWCSFVEYQWECQKGDSLPRAVAQYGLMKLAGRFLNVKERFAEPRVPR